MHKKITIENILSKSPRKNRKIRPKNNTLKRIGVCAALAGMFALECYISNYLWEHPKLSPINTQSAYSRQIEKNADPTPPIKTTITKTVLVKPISTTQLLEQKCANIPKLNIPNDIPDYLAQAIEKHKDFRLTDKEEKIVAKWDPLLKYFSTLDIFNKGHYTDPMYMKAIVAVESRGDPKACSPFKARGLFQIRYWRAKAYAERLLQNKDIDLGKIAKDIENLGYDASYINKDNLKNFKAKNLHNPAMGTLMFVIGDYINHCRFGNRMDLKLAEWNAGLGRGIVEKQVTNIKETTDYIGKNNALYKNWYN